MKQIGVVGIGKQIQRQPPVAQQVRQFLRLVTRQHLMQCRLRSILRRQRAHLVLRTGIGGKVLDKVFAVPAIHTNGDSAWLRLPGACAHQLQRGITQHRHAPGKAQRARGGKADAHAGKATGAERDKNAIRAALARQFGNHRHQPLGMAAPNDLAPAIDQCRAIEQGRRAGFRRTFYRKRFHAPRLGCVCDQINWLKRSKSGRGLRSNIVLRSP